MDKPKNYEYFVDSTYYKIGRFGYVFMWNNGDWHRSGKTESDLKPKKRSNLARRGKRGLISNKDKVLDVVKKYGSMSKLEITIMTDMSPSSITHALKDLRTEAKISYKDSTGEYCLFKSTQFDLFNIRSGI